MTIADLVCLLLVVPLLIATTVGVIVIYAIVGHGRELDIIDPVVADVQADGSAYGAWGPASLQGSGLPPGLPPGPAAGGFATRAVQKLTSMVSFASITFHGASDVLVRSIMSLAATT